MWQITTRQAMAGLLPKQCKVAEIGVQRGRFAREIYRRAQPAKLHLIDCWQQQADEHYQADGANVDDSKQNANLTRTMQRLAAGIREGRVEIHRDYSTNVLPQFPDHYFDWVYVDANHTYDAVLADLESCLPKINPMGFIAGHDYIDTPYWQQRHYGVVAAVEEFCRRHGWHVVAVTSERGNDVDRRGNPSFVLRRKGQAWQPVGRAWWGGTQVRPLRAA